MALLSINPATEETIASYKDMPLKELESVLELSQSDFQEWSQLSFHLRQIPLITLAGVLRDNKEKYGKIISQEMGKPIVQAEAEVEKCAWVCEFYAEKAEEFLSPEEVETEASQSWVAYQPLGIVLGIMPWNFPFWQVFRFAVPAMMAGNSVVVKHAPNVTGSALAIEESFREAGFPENLYRTVLIAPENVPEHSSMLIEHPLVKAVTVTGSTGAGRYIAAKAGMALKKSVMELGGNDPYIVLEDANLEETIGACVLARLQNAGQSCIAAKRFIVNENIREKFEEFLVRHMTAKKMGNPLDRSTDIGPIARVDLREGLHRQVEESIKAGATLLLGGKLPEGKGYFYPPTILTNVKKGMPAYSEETFGPVASIITVEDDDEAVKIANDSEYGLGSAIFTQNISRAQEIAAKLETGNCFINSMVKSDPRLPFGGVKQSGYGRELSQFGIREFVNIKTHYIK
ncbi:Aldehyde Dehydrogenase [Chloroherpeton thalassium ATCC 35110]|uniref:Aldehyde Dehydrogenase n=1 Tax=Chloroherpeton thalassium (strain ATCC 35110 / GB-78) TaxID=517418 RepID=B3QWK7_CHLT3|nr:NAD-dependent succinate-semialdehyde dehydrogenase [Chloroherpeton thalassium]ACF14767.1 Aldehyde Dehydrogenase [Chloroherpeton thalassium ATCC 35110]